MPLWLLEYGFGLAAMVGVAFSVVAEALFQTRSRARTAFIAVACAGAVFFAGYAAREPLDSTRFVEGVRVVTVFLGLVGGNFFYGSFQTRRWRALYSAPAIMLYGVATFNYWYEHRSSSLTPSTVPSPSRPIVQSEMAAPSPAPPLDRVTLIGRELDSTDPATRSRGLREAVGSGDTYLRAFALSKAFGASDGALRSTALQEAVRSSSSLTITIVSHVDGIDVMQPDLGTTIRLEVHDEEDTRGRFRVGTSMSDTGGTLWVTGESMAFTVPADKLFKGSSVVCSGTEALERHRSQLRGTMRCVWSTIFRDFTSDYEITTDLI